MVMRLAVARGMRLAGTAQCRLVAAPLTCRTAPAAFTTAPRRWKTLYAKSHEYIKIDGDIGTVGITDFAAAALGDVVYAELPSVGTECEAGSPFGSVESVKAASDVYAPMSGEVVEINEELTANPSHVNSAAMTDGWFIKIKLSDHDEAKNLLHEKEYKKMCDDSKK